MNSIFNSALRYRPIDDITIPSRRDNGTLCDIDTTPLGISNMTFGAFTFVMNLDKWGAAQICVYSFLGLLMWELYSNEYSISMWDLKAYVSYLVFVAFVEYKNLFQNRARFIKVLTYFSFPKQLTTRNCYCFCYQIFKQIILC